MSIPDNMPSQKSGSFIIQTRPRQWTMRALLFIAMTSIVSLGHAANWMTVKDDIADVRSEPVEHPFGYDHDPKQETQVLKGELIHVLKIRDGWAYVRCIQQPEFTHHKKWEGYPGWIKLTALEPAKKRKTPLRTPAVQDATLRQQIVAEARKLIGAPYFWGGRSEYDPNNKTITTGVDCSGLLNLSYWNVGWDIPRDAHEQYLKAQRIDASQLQPGDFIFLTSPGIINRITHVLMMATATTVIEAPQTGEHVREIDFDSRLGIPRTLAKNGDTTPDRRTIYFGRFFNQETK